MRLVKIEKLEPGMVVGRALQDEDGNTLLNENVTLSQKYIDVLASKGLPTIYIKSEAEDLDLMPDEDLSPEVRAHAVKVLRTAFDDIENELGDVRHESFEKVRSALDSSNIRVLTGEDGPLKNISGLVTEIFDDILTRTTLAGLTSIKSEDTHLHNHSIDVCVVAIMIGKILALPGDQMRQLATGCLLHDIGKLFLDKRASEVSQVRQHTLLGYELLRNNEDLLAPHVAFEHHEHQDGSGEPRGLQGSNTTRRNRNVSGPVPTLIGEIAAVANVYDNLLTGSASRPPMTPEAVLQTIESVSGTHLNKAIVTAFRRVVPVYPLGTDVLLRGGDYHNFRGIVNRVNPEALDRPTVLLVKDNHGQNITAIEVDLKENEKLALRTLFLT